MVLGGTLAARRAAGRGRCSVCFYATDLNFYVRSELETFF